MEKWSSVEKGIIVKTVMVQVNKIISIASAGDSPIVNSNGIQMEINGRNQSTFSGRDFIDAGWLPHDYDQPGAHQYQGAHLVVEETRINIEIIDKTPEEISVDNLAAWEMQMSTHDSKWTSRMEEDQASIALGSATIQELRDNAGVDQIPLEWWLEEKELIRASKPWAI